MEVVRQGVPRMRPLSEFLDYRKFLEEFCEFQNDALSNFSRAAFAESIGMDADSFARVMERRDHLPEGALPRILEILGLHGFQAEYFGLLVRFGRWADRRQGKENDGWSGSSVR